MAILFAGVLLGQLWGMDIDTGKDAVGAAKMTESLERNGWARLRGADLAKEPETWEASVKLRTAGLRTCVLLRWPAKNGRAHSLPDDLREAYERGRKFGATYGDRVDAWEVENEPDLGAVPEMAENYAALLKATYLGFQHGFAEAKLKSENPQVSGLRSQLSARAPLVLMGALGLPPGPWLERFAANDGFSYTDGFNYHYYGYADDFCGVYRQFESAVQALSSGNSVSSATSVLKKDWPIFLTEIGYGMLGKVARDTKEGRLRQWRWFQAVGNQASSLRIEAPMAFYLPPYLEYDTLEFGLTVAAKQAPGKPDGASAEMAKQTGNLKPEKWIAGGIEYTADDFREKNTESWMKYIGKEIGGNQITPALAWWLSARKPSGLTDASQPWTVRTSAPSPIVIDFIAGEGLSPIKRYNGSFVLGKEPLALRKSETGDLRPELTPKKSAEQKPGIPPVRTEEFMIHVRTANGNLYEVYPTRQATPEWQSYSEPQSNFTLSFYGRAEIPWRFKDNHPASLVVVMYPKQLPAVFEFRRVQVVRIGENQKPETGDLKPESFRYGLGKVILYNFSDKSVSGRLALPAGVGRVVPNTPGVDELMVLLPGERREIPVTVKVSWERFERIEVPVAFEPEDREIPTARFMTAFMPDIGGMKATVVAQLLRRTEDGEQRTESGNKVSGLSNHELVATRVRATEEAPMTEQSLTAPQVPGLKSQVSVFAQQGATVEQTTDGFTVTVTETPPGKQQRVEVEIPWPEGQTFPSNTFLAVEYRLRP